MCKITQNVVVEDLGMGGCHAKSFGWAKSLPSSPLPFPLPLEVGP